MRHVYEHRDEAKAMGRLASDDRPPPLDMEKCGGHAGLPLRPVARAAHATAHGPTLGAK